MRRTLYITLKTTLKYFCLIILLTVIASDASGHPQIQDAEWQRGYTLIVTSNSDIASANDARDYVISQGGKIAILIPPHIMLGWIPRNLSSELIGKHGIEYISYDPINIDLFKYRDERSLSGASFFNSVVSGELEQQPSQFVDGQPLVNDGLPHPEINYDDYVNNLQRSSAAPSIGNSDSMTGSVAVVLFFVESNGAVDPNSYSWSPTDQQNTINRAISGLSWWSNRASSYSKSVAFTVYYYSATESITQQSFEPILHRSSEDAIWINQIMGHLGYTSGDKFARVTAYNTWLKGWAGTNWAYSVFIGYNPSPASTTFQPETNGASFFAYAYKGGPYVQMLFRNDGYAVTEFGRILTHETGHIFWACDEYYQAGYGGCTSCNACSPDGPRPSILNGNCEYCNSNSVACMMRSNEDSLCAYTPQQIGWSTSAGGVGTTVGLYNPTTSTFFLRNTNTAGTANLTFPYGPANSGWTPIVGDWDGNGTVTVGLYNPATSTFYLRNTNSAGVADLTFSYGPAGAGWKPVVGDWDGNGTDTVGLYNGATSTFFLRNTNSVGVANLTFSYGPAGAGWTPLAGDWNGDGTDSVGLYNGTTSTLFLRNTNSAGVADLTFAYGPTGAGWKPLTGDWNKDGLITAGLYAPSSSMFFLRNTNTAGIADVVFGYGPAGAGWIPLAGNWTGQ